MAKGRGDRGADTGVYVTLRVEDGTGMRAFVVRPEQAESCPGILVLQEAFGVNAHMRDVATRFARRP